MNESKREKLKQMLIDQSLTLASEPITLASGRQSDFYFDGKIVATDPEGAPLITEAMKDLIGDTQVDTVGGITLGADPMLGALSGGGYFRTFIIRKEPKKHGKQKWIEGQLTENDRKVIIIDDVATTGTSILDGIKIVKREFPFIEIIKILVLVDREEGAKENLENEGYVLESIFKANELLAIKREWRRSWMIKTGKQ